MSYESGMIVVVRRQAGTQVALLGRELEGGWFGHILSTAARKWTKAPRWIPSETILGPGGTEMTRKQRAALRAAGRP